MSKLKAKAPEVVPQGKTKCLIFGASGVGKTWFSLTFPRPYFIDTEGGAQLEHYRKRLTEVGGVYMGQAEGALDFGEVIGQIQALATEKHEYSTLIIDSITKLYQTAIANEVERLGDKDAFGASKKPAIAGMRRLVNWIMRLDMNVIFCAHETNEWGVNPKSGQREEIGKMSDIWDKLTYELDLSLRVIRQGKIYPATAIVTKSRLEGFQLGDTFPLEYAEYATRYGFDAIERATAPITLASAKQIAEIERLVELLKVSEAETEKILNRARADSWKELSEEQAEKTIKYFNAKIKGEK